MSADQKQKEVNYTSEMVEALRNAAPLNLQKAKELADQLGKSYRSIIAKAKSEGIEYVSTPAPAKKAKGSTKAEKVAALAAATSLDLDGLEKAPVAVLDRLTAYVEGVNTPAEEGEQ